MVPVRKTLKQTSTVAEQPFTLNSNVQVPHKHCSIRHNLLEKIVQSYDTLELDPLLKWVLATWNGPLKEVSRCEH